MAIMCWQKFNAGSVTGAQRAEERIVKVWAARIRRWLDYFATARRKMWFCRTTFEPRGRNPART